MAGRGRAPEILSPEFIAALRHRYLETDQPVRQITAEFDISVGRLNRLIAKEGWPMRQDRPPRELPAAVRLLEEVRVLAAESSSAPTSIRHPEVRAQRASTNDRHDRAESGPSPSRLDAARLAPQDDGERVESAIARIEQLVVKEIAAEEAVRARLGNAPRGASDAERSARTLSILTQTLQNLQRLRSAQGRNPQNQSGSPDDDDDMPANLDEFRRELARRIDAFVASRTDERDAERDRTADNVAAAR